MTSLVLIVDVFFSVEKDDSILKIFIQEFSFRDILKIEGILG